MFGYWHWSYPYSLPVNILDICRSTTLPWKLQLQTKIVQLCRKPRNILLHRKVWFWTLKGGLNIKDMSVLNEALLLKQLWSFATHPELSVSETYNARNYPNSSPGSGSRSSHLWKNLSKIKLFPSIRADMGSTRNRTHVDFFLQTTRYTTKSGYERNLATGCGERCGNRHCRQLCGGSFIRHSIIFQLHNCSLWHSS